MYWDSILDPDELLKEDNPAHCNLIQKLRSVHLKAADFSKKRSRHSLFSMKLNDAFRVVFAEYLDPIKKTSHLLLLDIFEGEGNAHKKYERFLSGDDAYQKQLRLVAQLEQHKPRPIALKPKKTTAPQPDTESIDIKTYDYYGHQPIHLSTEQDEVLTLIPPILIEGPPGSGKSSTALQLLLQLILQKADRNTPIIYLAPKKLRAEMQAKWQEMAAVYRVNVDDVLFIDPDELVKYCLDPEAYAAQNINLTIVGEKFFSIWLKKNRATQPLCDVDNKYFNNLGNSSIYREFKIITAIGIGKYTKLGERACRVAQEHRQQIIIWFNNYLEHLQSLDPKVFDPTICELKLDEKLLDEVVVDETQSIPASLLKKVIERNNKNNFCFMDTNQVTNDVFTTKRYLEKLTNRRQFTGSYRVPTEIAQPIQRLLTAKYTLAEGQADIGQTYTFKSNINTPGNVNWVTDNHDAYLEKLKQQCQDPHTRFDTAIVIFDEKQREIASQTLDTDLIFLPNEVQGFEFPYIILWDPLNTIKKIPLSIWQQLPAIADKKTADPLSRPRESVSTKEENLLAVNKLFIAMSRSLKEVSFYLPSVEKSDVRLVNAFQKALQPYQPPQPCKEPVVTPLQPNPPVTTAASAADESLPSPKAGRPIKDILNQVKKFILNEKIKLAKQLFSTISGDCKQSFDDLKNELKQQQQLDMNKLIRRNKKCSDKQPKQAPAATKQNIDNTPNESESKKEADIEWFKRVFNSKGNRPLIHLTDLIEKKPDNFSRMWLNISGTPEQEQVLMIAPKLLPILNKHRPSFLQFIASMLSDPKLWETKTSGSAYNTQNYFRVFLLKLLDNEDIAFELIANALLKYNVNEKIHQNPFIAILEILKKTAQGENYPDFFGKIYYIYAHKLVADGTDESMMQQWCYLAALSSQASCVDRYVKLLETEFKTAPHSITIRTNYLIEFIRWIEGTSKSFDRSNIMHEINRPLAFDRNSDFYKFSESNRQCIKAFRNSPDYIYKLEEVANSGNPMAHHEVAMCLLTFPENQDYSKAIKHFKLACLTATDFAMPISFAWLNAFATALQMPQAIECLKEVKEHQARKPPDSDAAVYKPVALTLNKYQKWILKLCSMNEKAVVKGLHELAKNSVQFTNVLKAASDGQLAIITPALNAKNAEAANLNLEEINQLRAKFKLSPISNASPRLFSTHTGEQVDAVVPPQNP